MSAEIENSGIYQMISSRLQIFRGLYGASAPILIESGQCVAEVDIEKVLTELIAIEDEAMYRAKNNGQNCVGK